MFNVKHNECVGFESRWKVKKVSCVGSSQTTGYLKSDMETTTSEKKSVEIQTDAAPAPTHVEVDEEKLAAWLKNIYPKVKRELDDMANSKAFCGYKLSSDNTDANCKLLQTLDLSSQLKDPQIGVYVSALSWNSTNKVLAVSCTYKHSSWCYHEGVILCYTLDRDDNLPQTPSAKITIESCATVLQFHPVLPAIIAAGMFNGVIIVWNIEKKEEDVTKINGHGDRITQLAWIPDINYPKNLITTSVLTSSSLDGFVTLWDFKTNELLLTLKEKHQIRSPLLPKASETSPEETVKKIVRGVTCFDFSKHSPEIFVVGAEGGLVVQCSQFGATKLPESTKKMPVLDSAVKYYEYHKGEIASISFSPNRNDMFMTAGSDSEIRIYMIDQEEPAQVIFLTSPLNCVIWVPYEEKIICGCGKRGVIEIFQLIKGNALEDTLKDKVKVEVLTQIQINKAKTNIVAVGTEKGHVQMWRVPWGLFGKM